MKTCVSFLFAFLLLSTANRLHAQGTAYNYQGQLNTTDGPANGFYDFQFFLSNAPSGGNRQRSVSHSRPRRHGYQHG